MIMSRQRTQSGSARPVSSLAAAAAATTGQGRRSRGGGTAVSVLQPGKLASAAEDLRLREEECMRRNAELGERTSKLMQEAQALLEQESRAVSPQAAEPRRPASAASSSRRPGEGHGTAASRGYAQSRPKTVGTQAKRRATPLAATARPPSAPQRVRRRPTDGPDGGGGWDGSGVAAAMATAREAALLAEAEQSSGSVLAEEGLDADVGGAVNRLLKARVVVLQEELQAMAAADATKDAKIKQLENSVKQAADERSSIAKQLQVARTQLERQNQAQDQARQTNASLEKQLSALRKDYEASQATVKQLQASQSALDVRLNRALEEVDRCKSTIQQRSSQAKDSSEHTRHLVDQLQAQAKQHEKQKNDLIAIFKKQQRLIDVLKQQKMHIEAARVLEFSETEFINLLEWGSAT